MLKKNNKGFTLLELLVALAIIGIIMFAFFRIFDSSTRLNFKNDRDIKALNIAQSEIENLRSQIKSLGEGNSLKINDEEVLIEQITTDYTKSYSKNYEGINYNIILNLSKKSAGSDMYLFDIVVKAKVGDYFSKKETELATSVLSMGEFNDDIIIPPTEETPDDSIEKIPNGIIENAHHEIRIDRANGAFWNNMDYQEYNTRVISNHSQFWYNPEEKFAVKDSNFILQYKANIDNKEYTNTKIIVKNYSNQLTFYDEGGPYGHSIYKKSKKLGIILNNYGGNPGVKLKNVYINNISVGDISEDTVFKIDRLGDDIVIKFDGFEDIHTSSDWGRVISFKFEE